MHPIMNRSASERGAVLVQTAIAFLVLLGLTTFVVDQGVLWVARNQAQTAADAGALAGAIGLAYDDSTYPPTADLVKLSAAYAALCASGSSSCTSEPSKANPVWPAQSGASSAVDVYFGCPTGVSGNCVRVNVYRNGETGNVIGDSWMLPTFFGPLLGIQSPTAAGPLATGHGVKATATARVTAANATNCLRPFAIPDNFWDNDGDGTFTLGTDDYYPPTSDDPGSGYAPIYNLGDPIILKDHNQISSGNFRLLDLLGGKGGGTSQAEDVIKGCTSDVYAIGDQLPVKSGGSNGIVAAMNAVYDLDSGAYWNTTQKKIVNSCVDTHTCHRYVWDSSGNLVDGGVDPTATVSPRVLILPLYDPQKEAIAQAGQSNADDLEIVNFVGFFYTGMDSDNPPGIHGLIVTEGGSNLLTSGGGTVSIDSAFLKVIQLIR